MLFSPRLVAKRRSRGLRDAKISSQGGAQHRCYLRRRTHLFARRGLKDGAPRLIVWPPADVSTYFASMVPGIEPPNPPIRSFARAYVDSGSGANFSFHSTRL
jgi:hypothetical protein